MDYKLAFITGCNKPGALAGEMGPDRDWLEPAGEPTGEGEGPLWTPGSRGEAWGEKGDRAGLLGSPWLLLLPLPLPLPLPDPPEAAPTTELRPASVPVGRSSMEPDRSWNRGNKDIAAVRCLPVCTM